MRKKLLGRARALALSSLISGLSGMVDLALAEPEPLAVSAATVAGNDESSEKLADYFVQRIGLGRNYLAKRAPACVWDELPPGSAAESQVNLVQLKFDNRIEHLAIMLEPGGHTVALTARAPALIQPPRAHAHQASPGDQQLPENAPNDLVANFALAREQRAVSKGTFQLIIKPWEQPKSAGEGGAAWDKAFSPKEAGIMRIYPLAAAALDAEQFRASTQPQDSVITLAIKMDEMECTIQAVLSRGKQTVCDLERGGIPYEKLYDSLRALFLNLVEWQGTVADFHTPRNEGFQPLAVTDVESGSNELESNKTVVIGKDKEGFLAFEPATGNKTWETPYERNGSGIQVDGLLFLSTANKLGRLSAATGKSDYSITVESLDRLAARGDWCAVGVYNRLSLFDKAAPLWSQKLPFSIQAGPLLTDDGVVLADAKGEVRCYSLKGEERWKLPVARNLSGEMYKAGGLFFADDDKGGLTVIDPQGRLAWQAEIGDVMTGPPQVVGDTVLVGSKAGALFLFDKKTGAFLKKQVFHSWLLGFRVVGKKVLCVTLDKRLHVFDAARFEMEKTLRFPFALNPELLPVKDFQLRRQGGIAGPAGKITGCLLTDVKGRVYVIAVPDQEGRS